MNKTCRVSLGIFAICLFGFAPSQAQQFLTEILDTNTQAGKDIYPIYGKYDRLRFVGYLQPQFQKAESEGADGFAGGNFAPMSDNRFTIRRGRLRLDYAHYNEKHEAVSLVVFQFDGSERGFFMRDYWGRLYENKFKIFSVTTGMFARPMGFELNTSSASRESPERGRMSQTLMKIERDLGVMVTADTRAKKNAYLKHLKLDVGIFNGPGLPGTTDYDSHKDLIGRFAVRSVPIGHYKWKLSVAASGYYGGITNRGNSYYRSSDAGLLVDSATGNDGLLLPRRYYGADAQLLIPNGKWATELRAEYMAGQQTATATTSETPGVYPETATGTQPLYVRNFNGAYFYFLQYLGTDKLQLVVKYDWYDPNANLKGNQVAELKWSYRS